MESFIFSILLLVEKFYFAENVVCIPPSIPTKDKQGVDCCKLPPEIFPHRTIYEEFCSAVYFGTMANGTDGQFCRLSSSQAKRIFFCNYSGLLFYLILSYQLISGIN
ncbi:hypothetical protein LOAG_10596 [Loa loa]|uniref:BPTI/Kunitz inhibitor domain-containing protein n=1 Tax=Loa loa TaxID=7209 RepID=A0A1S0TPL6_LOALO|nr:hypothetical protein LOAG_10596 [Loa loa]EFO17901.1 hypothetical protein LOAG_10596 [Loa loa]